MATTKKNPTAIFEACKSISAKDAADRLGIELHQRGSKHWAHCFLHEDKTESLAFYEGGTFYCFSCKAGGDAVKLYSLYHDLKPLEAAERLLGDLGKEPVKGSQKPVKRPISDRELKRFIEDTRWAKINALLDVRREALEKVRQVTDSKGMAAEDVIWPLLQKAEAAQDRINAIEAMPEKVLRQWIVNGANIQNVTDWMEGKQYA